MRIYDPRKTRKAFAYAAAVSLGLVTAAGVPATAQGHDVQVLWARLTGAQEVPGPGDEDGKGIFAAVVKGGKVCYVLTAGKVATPVAAHIHAAPKGQAGGIVVALKTPDPRFARDCIRAVPDDEETGAATLSESELAAIRANPDGYYANVHNADFPAGAIRGQLR